MESKKVLIIDDDPLTCQLLSKMLSLRGFTSATLTDAKLALTTVVTEKPNLILMDYHLGTSHGLEVLAQLRADETSRQLPVIMTSGIDRRSEVMAAGAQDFLVKPFNWGTLAKTIEIVLKSGDHT
jgi:DNA-binding response OmpR family regulator